MKHIAVIDADLLERKRHRFPNLCCMKISGYHKAQGDDVTLKLDYDALDSFDHVYIAKVFSDTLFDRSLLELPNVTYGGTGFFFDKAPTLPTDIEHSMPDYHLYDSWACTQKPTEIKYYRDYSIGYLTRGCFRHCPFCVNRSSDGVKVHSPLKEFVDVGRPKIALLDDNFFGCDQWQRLLVELQDTGKRFSFRQGLDIRLLDDDKAGMLKASKYDGDIFFAFDHIADDLIIKQKMLILQRHQLSRCRFYVLCGFDPRGVYDEKFWLDDLRGVAFRINIIRQGGFLPYIMRFEACEYSKFRVVYGAIAAWCNQPALFKKLSLLDFVHRPSRENDCRHVSELFAAYPKFQFLF